MILAQELSLPPDAPAWLTIMVMGVSTVAYLLKRWADIRLKEADAKIANAEARATALQRSQDEDAPKPPILYVDDSASDYELFRHLLRSVGCEHKVVWVTTPEDGYVYMREYEVVTAIVDINMVSNGHRFLETVKGDSRTSDVPVIVTSGIVPEDVKIYNEGAVGYLPKPIQLNPFLQIMGRHGRSWSLRHNAS